MCYCGLYCENCAVKVKVEPASKMLYKEMKTAGFEEIINYIPDGDKFWSFLKGMAEQGVCVSCKEGSGNPGCVVRRCAQAKGVEMCAWCEDYPCEHFTRFFEGYPVLKYDNDWLRKEGLDEWSIIQDARRERNFTYSEEKQRKIK